jgi:NAD(P)-dependent dehydrogenase (short-subunit alcohol dehydrogenase family)
VVLEDQVAVVTGGGRDIDADTAAETVQASTSRGGRGLAKRVDVSDHAAVVAAVEDLASTRRGRRGRLHGREVPPP